MYFRDEDYLVFDDKFGVSANHLDIIPTRVYDDVTSLTERDIPVLERMFELGKAEFARRQIPPFDSKLLDMDDFLVAGFNYPVSVKHLHLHMVLPPFSHQRVFQYPRWHPFVKVIADLRNFGCVRTYTEFPNEEAGKVEYNRAMDGHHAIQRLLESGGS